jgi:hypothetical protein
MQKKDFAFEHDEFLGTVHIRIIIVSSMETRKAVPNEFDPGFIALVNHLHEVIRLPCHGISHEGYAEPDEPNGPNGVFFLDLSMHVWRKRWYGGIRQ